MKVLAETEWPVIPGPGDVLFIQAMDAKSFNDFVDKNAAALVRRHPGKWRGPTVE
jgi:hypothetical protein